MARYKPIDTNPRFLPVDLARQLLPGTFEHAVNHLLDHAIDRAAPAGAARGATCMQATIEWQWGLAVPDDQRRPSERLGYALMRFSYNLNASASWYEAAGPPR
jgi:hypothetical protein